MSSGTPATFAAGCYWGTERYFAKQFGAALLSHKVGFMGGRKTDAAPTYQQVCSGTTGHAEVLHVEFDESRVSFGDLVQFFFRMHNPTTLNHQGNDKGTQYRSAIFYHNEEQRRIAEQYMHKLTTDPALQEKLKQVFGSGTVVTSLEPASTFFPAHEEHQEYLEHNPNGYCNHKIYW
jgi:peptide-methionine (S)-S-oxide reductase